MRFHLNISEHPIKRIKKRIICGSVIYHPIRQSAELSFRRLHSSTALKIISIHAAFDCTGAPHIIGSTDSDNLIC